MKHAIGHGGFRRGALCVAAGLLGFSYLSADVAQAADDELDAASFPQVEQKLKKLKKRVRQLETDVGELQALNLPVTVDVDCGAGQSIGNVLATHGSGLGHLTINVSGTCNETVDVKRSNVTLQGQGASTIIQGPANVYTVVVQNGAGNVAIADLKIVGGVASLVVSKSAYAKATNIISEQSVLGVMAADGGSLDVTASQMHNNLYGIYAIRGGVIMISNSIIEANTVGAIAFKGGTINLTSVLPGGTGATAGVTVRNNVTGGISRTGGLIELSDARVENNSGAGLVVDTLSTLHFFAPISGTGNVVTNNTAAGVFVQKNAGVLFTDSTNTITGNSAGIVCNSTSSYSIPASGPGNVSGNTNGDVLGCVP